MIYPNIERIDSDYSDRESREVAHQAEVALMYEALRQRQLLDVLRSVEDLTDITSEEVESLMVTLVAATKHMPVEHALLAGCLDAVSEA